MLSFNLGRRLLVRSTLQRIPLIQTPPAYFNPLLLSQMRSFSSAATTLNIDADESSQGVVPIKINTMPQLSEKDLLEEKIEKARG